MVRAASGPCMSVYGEDSVDKEGDSKLSRSVSYHDKVHQDEVHCSARGHFIPQLFHRGGSVVRGEEGGIGEDADLLALNQPHHHLDVQRRVILPQYT